MRFSLTIKCDNAAFRDDSAPDDDRNDEAAACSEVARILTQLVGKLEAGFTSGSLYDYNGNTVGAFSFDDGEGRRSDVELRLMLERIRNATRSEPRRAAIQEAERRLFGEGR